MTQPQALSPTRAHGFTWTSVAALAVNAGLAVYFLLGYLLARQFQPGSPTTVLRAVDFARSWPLARLAWTLAVLLALGLVGWALASRPVASGSRRALIVAVSVCALVSCVAALLVSPARPVTSPEAFHFGAVLNDAGGYALAGLLFLLAALLYAGAALASRPD